MKDMKPMCRALTAPVTLVGLLLIGCGGTNDDRPLVIPAATMAQPESFVGDPWVEALTVARYPIAVAYGFPDDVEYASAHLYRSFERKRARCLNEAGYEYIAELAGDPEAAEANALRLNALEPSRRSAFVVDLATCTTLAAEQTYLAAAVGLEASVEPGTGPTAAHSDEEGRAAEIAFILEHRDVLQQLVADLEDQ